jgi:hypothetical protein
VGHDAWQFVRHRPRDAALVGALLLNIVWGLIAFAFGVRAGATDDISWVIVSGAGVVIVLVSLWLAVLVRRIAGRVDRTARKAVITLLVLTVPVFLPPGADPLFLSFGFVTLALLAVAGCYWLAERQSTLRAAG